MLKRINPETLPKIRSPISYATVVSDLVFVSGIPPYHGDRLMPDTFEAQFHQVAKNLKAVLDEVGADWKDIVRSTVLLTDKKYFEEMNGLYRQYFVAPYPARTTFVAGLGVDGMLLEIECVVKLPTSEGDSQ